MVDGSFDLSRLVLLGNLRTVLFTDAVVEVVEYAIVAVANLAIA